jgi:hypothetical protein
VPPPVVRVPPGGVPDSALQPRIEAPPIDAVVMTSNNGRPKLTSVLLTGQPSSMAAAFALFRITN